MSGFSLRGVYKAPMGTTRREASYRYSACEAPLISGSATDHAGAWEDIPTESQTIAVLDFTPLLLERLDIHICDSTGGACLYVPVLKTATVPEQESVEVLGSKLNLKM